jgi:hypothetical protein
LVKNGREIWCAWLGVAALLLAAGGAQAQQTPGPARQEVLAEARNAPTLCITCHAWPSDAPPPR